MAHFKSKTKQPGKQLDKQLGWARYFKQLANWCLPYTCVFCGCDANQERELCTYCEAALTPLSHRCAICAGPLTAENEPIVCLSCTESPPPFDRICGLYLYQPPLAVLVRGLKFNSQLAYARLLGELMAERACSHWCKHVPLPQALIPVPLHETRLRQRGFNQALELARPLARKLKLPIDDGCCRRVKATLPQTKLVAHQRARNLQQAFAVVKAVPYEHVAIVDDVVTTGSTVKALSAVLKASGVERVEIWCVGRA